MKTLQELLAPFLNQIGSIAPKDQNLIVKAVVSDSRLISPGSLFVAVRGGTHDGHDFLSKAEELGAIAIVGEKEKPSNLKIPYFRVNDTGSALAALAATFYDHPTHSMLMFGVTGTSGKTTVTYLIESILRAAGHQVGVIGTVNFRYGNHLFDSTHTTPGAVELQKLLAQMKLAGCTAVVMEVSSHSLRQHRVGSIAFDGMVFTNLTPEHLDFHTDMDDYFSAKSLLFTEMVQYSLSIGKHPYGAINSKADYGARLLAELNKSPTPGFRFGGFYDRDHLKVSLDGIEGRVADVAIRSSLAGQFNAENILAAVNVCIGVGIKPSFVSEGVAVLKSVPGRLERVENSKNLHVFVDYAHKSDALDKVLRTLHEVKGSHRLITVFGCGGDRDRKKRPVMGRIAVEWSDSVFVTSDNPRTENPESIISEIIAGIPSGNWNYRVEMDRKKAIFAAIQNARQGDIVVIAGKGHENYQIIADASISNGTRKIHFDDREVAIEALVSKE